MNTLISLLFRIDRSGSKAFSLVESLIALLILSIGILAIAGVPIMTSKFALHAAQRDQAMFLAVQALDFLEAKQHDVAIVASQDVVGDYTRRFDKPNFATVSSDQYKATVTVSWRGLSGQSSLTLERPLSKFSSETREE